MSGPPPRLRVFAGPNGSGKSTLLGVLEKDWVGAYVNADDLERQLRTTELFRFQEGCDDFSYEDLLSFLRSSGRLRLQAPGLDLDLVEISGDGIRLPVGLVDSYLAAEIVEFLRSRLLSARRGFTFETVMSHPSKVRFLEQAHSLGYWVYLYFVATADPSINVERVASRVAQNGHPVPKDKIVERYHRVMELLPSTFDSCRRIYFFDNSASERSLLAQLEPDGSLNVLTEDLPKWFLTAVQSQGYLLDPNPS